MKSDLQMKKAQCWTVEAQTELEKIIDGLTPLVDRLHELANKGWYEKRSNVLRIAAARIRAEVNQIAEY